MSEFREVSRIWRAFIVLAALALSLVVTAPGYALPTVQLNPTAGVAIAAMQARYLPDPAARLDPQGALSAVRGGDGMPFTGPSLSADAPLLGHWIVVDLVNAASVPGAWLIVTDATFRPELSMWLIRTNGVLEPLLETDIDAAFAARPVQSRLLTSAAFDLAVDERVSLIIRHTAGGPGALALSAEPSAHLASMLAADYLGTGAFYGACAVGLIGFLAFSLSIGARTGAAYVGLLTLALLLVAQIDGVAFQFLWPEFPHWNGLSALPILLLLSGFGFFVAARVAGSRPRFVRTCILAAALCFCALVAIPVVPVTQLAAVAVLALVVMIGAQAIAISGLLTTGERLPRFAVAGAVTSAVLLALVAGTGFLGVGPALLTDSPQRLVYLISAVTVMALVPWSARALRRAHDAVLQRELEASRREAVRNRELFEMEKRYARARDLAAARRRDLATVSHDIKQPLASLRLSLASLLRGRDQGGAEISEAFDYLEDLVNSYVRPASDPDTAEPDTLEQPAAEDPEQESDAVPISLITATIDRMFQAEASAKGLTLACQADEGEFRAPVLPVMRLISNLVSNAIKHTEVGSVSISGHGEADQTVFVVSDTGPGLSEEQIRQFRTAGVKGERSDGTGWGLAIVDDLAADVGAEIDYRSNPGDGLTVSVAIQARIGSDE